MNKLLINNKKNVYLYFLILLCSINTIFFNNYFYQDITPAKIEKIKLYIKTNPEYILNELNLQDMYNKELFIFLQIPAILELLEEDALAQKVYSLYKRIFFIPENIKKNIEKEFFQAERIYAKEQNKITEKITKKNKTIHIDTEIENLFQQINLFFKQENICIGENINTLKNMIYTLELLSDKEKYTTQYILEGLCLCCFFSNIIEKISTKI